MLVVAQVQGSCATHSWRNYTIQQKQSKKQLKRYVLVLQVIFRPRNTNREKKDLDQTKQQHLEHIQWFTNPVYSPRLCSSLCSALIVTKLTVCGCVVGDSAGAGQSPVWPHEKQIDKSPHCCRRWKKTSCKSKIHMVAETSAVPLCLCFLWNAVIAVGYHSCLWPPTWSSLLNILFDFHQNIHNIFIRALRPLGVCIIGRRVIVAWEYYKNLLMLKKTHNSIRF